MITSLWKHRQDHRLVRTQTKGSPDVTTDTWEFSRDHRHTELTRERANRRDQMWYSVETPSGNSDVSTDVYSGRRGWNTGL